jgi:hypothetical protein
MAVGLFAPHCLVSWGRGVSHLHTFTQVKSHTPCRAHTTTLHPRPAHTSASLDACMTHAGTGTWHAHTWPGVCSLPTAWCRGGGCLPPPHIHRSPVPHPTSCPHHHTPPTTRTHLSIAGRVHDTCRYRNMARAHMAGGLFAAHCLVSWGRGVSRPHTFTEVQSHTPCRAHTTTLHPRPAHTSASLDAYMMNAFMVLVTIGELKTSLLAMCVARQCSECCSSLTTARCERFSAAPLPLRCVLFRLQVVHC